MLEYVVVQSFRLDTWGPQMLMRLFFAYLLMGSPTSQELSIHRKKKIAMHRNWNQTEPFGASCSRWRLDSLSLSLTYERGVALWKMTNFVSGGLHSDSQRNKKTMEKPTKSTIFMAFFVIGEEISLCRNNTNPHTREGSFQCWPVTDFFFFNIGWDSYL